MRMRSRISRFVMRHCADGRRHGTGNFTPFAAEDGLFLSLTRRVLISAPAKMMRRFLATSIAAASRRDKPGMKCGGFRREEPFHDIMTTAPVSKIMAPAKCQVRRLPQPPPTPILAQICAMPRMLTALRYGRGKAMRPRLSLG